MPSSIKFALGLLVALGFTLFGGSVFAAVTPTQQPTITPSDDAHRDSASQQEPEMSPESLQRSQDLDAEITTALENSFPAASMDSYSDAWKNAVEKLKVANTAKVEESISNWRNSGTMVPVSLSEIPLFGNVSITSQIQHNTNFMQGLRYAAPPSRHRIISATGPNHLEGANRRLKDITDKLSSVSCGNFDWVVQLKGKFNKEALTNYVTGLSESALAAAPMALLATWSPTLYEIVKWLRMFAGTEVDADAQSCAVMEGAMSDVGNRMVRGAGWPECMKQASAGGMAYNEANKACQGGEASPFDGLENRLGNIKGLGLDGASANLTDMAANNVLERENYDREVTRQVVGQSLTKAQSDLDAIPNPGPAPNPVTDAWKLANEKYTSALKVRDVAQQSFTLAAADTASNSSVWNALQYGLAKNARDLVGSIRVTGRADIDFPGLKKETFKLHFQTQTILLMGELREYLKQHARVVVSRFNGSTAYSESQLQLSYHAVGVYLAETMLLPGRSPNATTYATMDRMAWMVAMADVSSPIERLVLEERYRNEEHLVNCSRYEVTKFLWEAWKDGKDDLAKNIEDIIVRSQNPELVTLRSAIEKRFEEIDAIYSEAVTQARAQVLETLPLVNSYKLQHIPSRRLGGGQPIYAPETAEPSYYNP